MHVCACCRSNMRWHQGQCGGWRVLLHPQRRRPMPELHLPWWGAWDVCGCPLREAPGLPAVPQGPQGMLQVHVPGPRWDWWWVMCQPPLFWARAQMSLCFLSGGDSWERMTCVIAVVAAFVCRAVLPALMANYSCGHVCVTWPKLL